MRKSRESRWTCKTPSELLRCSSVGKAAAQSAEPDQESSAAVSALRRRRRMAGEVLPLATSVRHPVNFTPSPGARPWVPSPPRRLEGLSCSQVAHINITKTNHSRHNAQTIHPVRHIRKTAGPPRDAGGRHTQHVNWKRTLALRQHANRRPPARPRHLSACSSGSTSTVKL